MEETYLLIKGGDVESELTTQCYQISTWLARLTIYSVVATPHVVARRSDSEREMLFTVSRLNSDETFFRKPSCRFFFRVVIGSLKRIYDILRVFYSWWSIEVFQMVFVSIYYSQATSICNFHTLILSHTWFACNTCTIVYATGFP